MKKKKNKDRLYAGLYGVDEDYVKYIDEVYAKAMAESGTLLPNPPTKEEEVCGLLKQAWQILSGFANQWPDSIEKDHINQWLEQFNEMNRMWSLK